MLGKVRRGKQESCRARFRMPELHPARVGLAIYVPLLRLILHHFSNMLHSFRYLLGQFQWKEVPKELEERENTPMFTINEPSTSPEW